MFQRLAAFLAVPMLAVSLFGQGIDTQATKDDWEEINFDYNSSVLVDGFPSLLRLSELLQKNSGYKVRIEGHTDTIGDTAYNNKLGMARASAVRDFLIKYGARTTQIEVSSRGKLEPKYAGQKDAYLRTDEARWMNRRVALTVLDDQGRTVGAGGAGDAIRAMQPAPTAGLADCCSEVLKRLDKLDAIERMLMDLADQNKKLADEVARLRQNQDAMAGRIQPPPPAPPAPPTTDEVATAVTNALAKKELPKFQLLGMNVGANSDGNASFTGKGRYFAPFGNNYAFQSEGEYFYSKGQREGQFDFGLVDRINRFQAGLFGSFKHVNLTGDQTGGTLGQGAVTMEYLFKWGKLGVFGTKAFLDDALVNSANVITPSGAILNNLFTERYLRVVDQAGMSGTFGLFGKNYAEGNLGYLRSTTAGDRVGGTLRLIFPVSNKIAFTLEGGMNETLLGRGNNGRVVAGVQFGNTLRPTDYLESKHPVPVQIPRLRYEVLTRTVRKGNAAPVADAGPNQILPAGATVTLDGSASYDPDGDPITYQWVQDGGPGVTLSAPTSAKTNFTAATGQNYSFRLTVKDPYGAQGIARVSITAGTPVSSAPIIVNFAANPSTINAGQSSTLSWQVQNADTVVITTLGTVALNGSQAVTPATTTTYTLTATHGTQTATANATVTVNSGTSGGLPVIVSFAPNPATIDFGQSSSLLWVVQNATTVTIDNNIGSVGLTGSHAISPAASTTYTITATNAVGTVTAKTTLTVVTSVQIIAFTATPSSTLSGGTSILVCETKGAATVNVNGVVFTTATAVESVRVITTTTYNCTATAANGQTASAQTTVTVTGPIDPALPRQ
jgi:K319L-like, PKD domain/OmpA family